MPGVWLCARSELRTRWRSWVALALLAALLGGVAMAAAAGARRTETAVPRSVERSNFSDVLIQQFDFPGVDYREIQRMPEVGYAYRSDNFFFTGETDAGRPLDVGQSGLIASPDPSVGISRSAPQMVRGRRANPDALYEAVPDEESAQRLGLDVGDSFTARFARPDELEAFFEDTGDPSTFPASGPEATFEVVGISATFPSTAENYPETRLTAAFHRKFAAAIAAVPSLDVYLTRGAADTARFEQAVEQLPHGDSVEFAEGPGFVREVQRGVHIQAGALWVLAGLGAIVALLLVSQGVARLTSEEAGDLPTLRAIGMPKRELVMVALVRATALGLVGALGAAALTVGLSPLSPVGTLARKAEPDPGLSFDWLVIVGGAAALFLVILAASGLATWRAARRVERRTDTPRPGTGPSTIAERLARAGASPSAANGIRMALEPGAGASAVPTRTSIAGTTIAIAAIATALTFAASLDRLVDTPALYGQTWDAQFGDNFDPDLADEVYPRLQADQYVEAFVGGTIGEASVEGKRVGALAVEPAQGTIAPSVVDGRAPLTDDEILLDPGTLDDLGGEVGDEVAVSTGEGSAQMKVVGTGVLTDVVGAQPLLGHSASLTFDGYRRLVPGAQRNYFFVRFKPGVDHDAALASLEGSGAVLGDKPVDVAKYGRVEAVPLVVGAFLVLIAVGTLFHTLVTSIRRRRRELAILKAVGFERSQISRVVAWQATTIVAIGALIGVPLGIAAGRWGWTIFAEELGVVPESVVPLVPMLILIPAALILANLIAAPPAVVAGRTRPAAVLRAE